MGDKVGEWKGKGKEGWNGGRCGLPQRMELDRGCGSEERGGGGGRSVGKEREIRITREVGPGE